MYGLSDEYTRSVIRAAQIADAPAIAAIYAPYVRDTTISFESAPPTADEILARMQSTRGRYPWLVDEVDGAVRGYAYASAHRGREAYQWCAEVSVYVGDRHHRQGIARGLYDRLFEILRELGYVNAYAGITQPNPASVAFHERMGFAPIGVYRRIGFKFDAWHDVGWWSLRLQDPEKPAPPRGLGGDA